LDPFAPAELAGLAAKGQGFDRHLYALRAIAMEQDPSSLPAIFSHEAFGLIAANTLSTSTVSVPACQQVSPQQQRAYSHVMIFH
jgi:hypothetical protein